MRVLLLVPLLVFATAKAESPPPKGLAFEISKAGWAESFGRDGAYAVGKQITIRCVFRNTGAEPVTLSLKDHDQYHGTLPYPQGVQARIEDSDHNVLTGNKADKQGWWTSFSLSSQLSSDEPGDNITIPPGEKVTRVVPLDEVLKGCDGLPNGLPVGHLVVQLRLFGPELRVESNSLEITVA